MVLCASENVDCIVVNDHHMHNMSIKKNFLTSVLRKTSVTLSGWNLNQPPAILALPPV